MPKTFRLFSFKLVMKMLFLLVLLFITVGVSFFSIVALSGFQNHDTKRGYMGIGLSLIALYAIYYHGSVIVLFVQYFANEKGKEITIDLANNRLIIQSKNQEIVITEKDLLSIESNISNKNSKNLTSEYDFVKLNAINGKVYIITNLIMKGDELNTLFLKTKRIIKFNNLNLINSRYIHK